mmetsp:Transcript_22314/g.76390  ORF Transcript_22314/g.76390 Transcript_22314/m.76390 type:complete len:225 (-) Transcript_22314:423-1097(-)
MVGDGGGVVVAVGRPAHARHSGDRVHPSGGPAALGSPSVYLSVGVGGVEAGARHCQERQQQQRLAERPGEGPGHHGRHRRVHGEGLLAGREAHHQVGQQHARAGPGGLVAIRWRRPDLRAAQVRRPPGRAHGGRRRRSAPGARRREGHRPFVALVLRAKRCNERRRTERPLQWLWVCAVARGECRELGHIAHGFEGGGARKGGERARRLAQGQERSGPDHARGL